MKNFILILLPLLFIGCTETIKTEKKFEPSGITKLQDYIYVVSDTGVLLKYDTKTKKQDYIKIGNVDFEAITTNGKNLFLLDEEKQQIHTLDGHVYTISSYYNGKMVFNPKGNNQESLTFIKEDAENIWFYTANQSKTFKGDDISSIAKIRVSKQDETTEIEEFYPMTIKDISDMQYVSDDLIYVISDTEDIIMEFNSKFELLKTKHLEAKNQEGIYIDEKSMYIAQDSGDIIIFKK